MTFYVYMVILLYNLGAKIQLETNHLLKFYKNMIIENKIITFPTTTIISAEPEPEVTWYKDDKKLKAKKNDNTLYKEEPIQANPDLHSIFGFGV